VVRFHKHVTSTVGENLTPHYTMGKRCWMTPDQRKWLEARIPEFVQAQKDKTTSSIFFPGIHGAWQQQWPIEPPTPDEVQHAKGDENVALALKTKATEEVSDSLLIIT